MIISPSNSNDYTSNDMASLSAITLAAAINSRTGQTGVRANIEETVIELSGLDEKKLEGLGGLQSNDFRINAIDIVGYTQGIWSLIETINNFSASTGVQARLISGSVNDLELYSTDGRNISVELNEEIAALLPFPSYESGLKVYNGSINLYSHNDFKLEHIQGFPILQDFNFNLPSNKYRRLITLTNLNTGLYSVDLSTQSKAQKSLDSIDKALSETNQLRVNAWLPQIYCR